ncbi:MAG: electron transport complex subunit RsxC [Chloroflexi bacterium]|nr:electron transport complex subunit RsxC [Chloroflexota bacterium]
MSPLGYPCTWLKISGVNKLVIRLKKRGTPYGVKVPESKLSEGSPIEPAPLPEKVIIPLQQNIGAPCQALVKRGDRVLTGQKIGDSEKFVSAPVHATLSGEVTGTTVVVNPPTGALVEALVITSDGEDKWVELEAPKKPEALSVKEILERIREAGLVGLGGAAFPTHVKLSPPKDKKIDTVILNGCECEPYVTSDHRLMLEQGERVLSGLNIIKKVLSPEAVYVAIEDNKEDAIDHMEGLIASLGFEDFKIVPLKSKYPMGAEKTLIDMILGREVPIGGLPLDVGVVVHNVSTAKAIHDAIIDGKPLIERVVTVTGAVATPKNLLTRFGTSLRNLIEYCGGMDGKANKVILGGPMMGIAQFDLDFPVVKGTNSVLVTEGTPIREQDCISCGKCIEICPMRLMPTVLARYAKAGRYDECKEAYIDDCFECGACSYTCPANIPIVQYIKVAKKELAKRAASK